MVLVNTSTQAYINESTLIRLCLDAVVLLTQRAYYASATMLFIVINEAVSLHLNDILQLLEQKDLLASQFDTLKESYYLCIEAVNEINDTFGWLLLVATLHDFVKIITESMYWVTNLNCGGMEFSYFLNICVVFLSLFNFTLVSFSGHRLTKQVIIKHSLSS